MGEGAGEDEDEDEDEGEIWVWKSGTSPQDGGGHELTERRFCNSRISRCACAVYLGVRVLVGVLVGCWCVDG